MRREIIKVLAAHSDLNILRYLSVEIPKVFALLDIYAHIITATTFKETRKRIEKEESDVACIDFNWEGSDGHGEDLIEFIKRVTPHQAIIAIMENHNAKYRLEISDKYYPILCPTKKMLFSDLKGYLEKTMKNLRPYSQKIDFETHTKWISFNLEEVAYLYGHAGKTIVFIYDFGAKKCREIEIPISITNFLAKYDRLNIFIRCHRDYAANRMMIRFVHKSRESMYIELIFLSENKYPLEIPMSESYKKWVMKQMKISAKGVDLK